MVYVRRIFKLILCSLEVEDSASQSKYVRQIACGFAHTAVVGGKTITKQY